MDSQKCLQISNQKGNIYVASTQKVNIKMRKFIYHVELESKQFTKERCLVAAAALCIRPL